MGKKMVWSDDEGGQEPDVGHEKASKKAKKAKHAKEGAAAGRGEEEGGGSNKLGADNVGFKMLSKMGFKEGEGGLGKGRDGVVDPIAISAKHGRVGLGGKEPIPGPRAQAGEEASTVKKKKKKDKGGADDGKGGDGEGGSGKGGKRGREDGGGGGESNVGKVQKLGAWHPKASLVKAQAVAGNVSLVLFYQYVEPLWSEKRQQEAIDYVNTLGSKLNLGGRVRVAREGFNATLSGEHDPIREFARALGDFDPHFKTTDFKYIDGLSADKHFKDLKVIPVQELVFYGIKPEDAVGLGPGGQHLEPRDYHAKMQESDAVIVDVRNHYEAAIGRFEKQMRVGGATLIDPKMRKSTDFTAWLAQEETKKQLEGKQVLMYCTGGVRCERASALIKNQLGEAVKGVFQLQGGIEKYMQEFPDGGFWAGKNKVFDKREACGIEDINGVGGVVKSEKAKKGKKGKGKQEGDEEVLGRCCVCSAPWERYIGKKKCYSCGVPVLMCSKCLEKKPDKGSVDQQLTVRCPLCKQEGRTEAASEVEWTENGTVAKEAGKGTVLKWGGGHAKSKKEERQKQRKAERGLPTPDNPSSRVCKFGAKCWRTDCWFAHPEKDET